MFDIFTPSLPRTGRSTGPRAGEVPDATRPPTRKPSGSAEKSGNLLGTPDCDWVGGLETGGGLLKEVWP